MDRVAVVTAVAGGHDNHQHHLYYVDNVDYLFFTDGSVHRPDERWLELPLPDVGPVDSRRAAKLPKLNPHAIPILNQYRYIIWIDGSMAIASPTFIEEILSYLQRGIIMSPHFDGRFCGYSEAAIRNGKYANEPLEEQVAFYKSEGFPMNYGLCEAGVHAKDMTYPRVKEFGEIWFQQNLEFSYNDQVSFGYSLWKSGLEADYLPRSWREYSWVHLDIHTTED